MPTLEHLVHHPDARFVRVHPRHPEVPQEIAARSLAVRAGAADTVAALTARVVPGSASRSC